MKYPVKCEIVDVDGDVDGTGQKISSFISRTPDISRPHIGKKGLAELMENGNVRITLDDGSVIYGYRCWWKPLETSPGNKQ